MSYRVLVVEDDPDYAEIYQGWLHSQGYVCTVASSIAQAQSSFRYYDPHVVVLDLALSSRDEMSPCVDQGFEVAQSALRRNVPVVIVTAFSDYVNAREAFKRYRVVDFISKQSLSEGKLIDAVYSAIQAFEQTSSETQERDAIEVQESINLLARSCMRPSGSGLKVSVSFFPSREFVQVSWSHDVAGWAQLASPFEGKMSTVLKLFTRSLSEQLDEEETQFLESLGFEYPLSEEDLKEIGEELYRSITLPHPQTSTRVGELERLLARESRGPDYLHLYFSEQTAALASYPWELMHDGRRFLARLRTRIARSIVYGESARKIDIGWPARILMVVPRPSDEPKLGEQEERALRRIRALTGSKYSVSRLYPPVTYKRLSSRLSQARADGEPFDILYFDGHGDFGWECVCGRVNPPSVTKCRNRHCNVDYSDHTEDRPECEGFLRFESQTGFGSSLNPTGSVAVFGDADLQLVILSACSSTMIRGTSLFNSVGPKLVETGIPAVVGMQFPVSATETASFFEAVFKFLVDRKRITATTLETALRNARKQLDWDTWFYPAVYLRTQSS
jgi:CheY-like chemotaxis protein